MDAALPSSSLVQCSSSSLSSNSSFIGSRVLPQLYRHNVCRRDFEHRLRSSIKVSASHGSGDSVVTLLDYGAGNVRSVRNAISRLGFNIKDVETPEDILKAARLIFPGVGAFAPAMGVLNEKGYSFILVSFHFVLFR